MSHLPTHHRLSTTEFVTLLTIALSFASPVAGGVVSTAINPANGHTYHLLTPDTWGASEAEAVALGGHLATINDDLENSWVYEQFSALGGVERGLWIGLNDIGQEGVFVWVSGDPIGYLNWGAGEPNNITGDENFVHLLWPSDVRHSQWNDLNDRTDYGGIPLQGVVELPSLPEPSLTGLVAAALVSVMMRFRLRSDSYRMP